MRPDDLTAPSLADFERMAWAAFDALPEMFRKQCAGLVIQIADYADTETLDRMGIRDASRLTGLYYGVALTEKSILDVATQPDTVWLYRRPIIEEWAMRGDVTLADLVNHVLVHEIAHHFGYSDDDIAEIDDWRL